MQLAVYISRISMQVILTYYEDSLLMIIFDISSVSFCMMLCKHNKVTSHFCYVEV